MSNRGPSSKHALPANPTWVEFERTDGDQSLWPNNTDKNVDDEGHVNYMRFATIDEPLCIKWRVEVGKALAGFMNLSEGQDYVLKEWPQGYQMFDHNKGPEDAPRHDAYLMGSKFVTKFRSVPEFIPHALWLLQDATQDRSNCKCKYCTKAPQRAITTSLGLLPKRTPSVSATPPRRAQGLARVAKQRENREREQHKPYAAVRRAPKPPKQPIAHKANMLRERNADLRAAYSSSGLKLKRWFREGELLWCALSVPIRGDKETITFWPGLVEEVKLKSEAIPRDPTRVDKSTAMNGTADKPPSSPVGPPTDWRVTEHPSSVDSGPMLEGSPPLPWMIRQSTVYKMKLLAVSQSYSVPDDQVLPYQAYAPTTELLNAVQTVPFEDLDTRAERVASFNPCPAPPSNPKELNGFVSNESGLRFTEAAAPYAVAVQIAATLAGCWTMTDEWDFKHAVGPTVGPNGLPLTQPSAPKPMPSLHDVLTASMGRNATSNAMAESGSMSSISNFKPLPQLSMAQTVTQRRYQGMWWGAERIWMDDLIRLKVARRQVAPEGTEYIFPPAGPSQKTVEYNSRLGFPNPGGKEFDASGRGVFMKLEALFIANVPREDGLGTREQVRASGMLYELADEDWQDSEVGRFEQQLEVNGKTPEPSSSGQGPVNQDTTSGITANPPVVQAGPSSMPGTSSLPNPDSAVLVSLTASSMQPSPNTQLSRPANSERYPMPPAPTGFKFRPILPPGHESVVSLTLVSGRYYPRLLSHPLLQSIVDRALIQTDEYGGPMENEHLWAMEGLSPGSFNCVDPTHYKKDRLQMMKDADKEAHMELEAHWRERQKERATKLEEEPHENQLMDVGP